MTRVNVAIEGKATTDGRVILPGALLLPVRVIPLTYSPDPDQEGAIIGMAHNFRREDDLKISCEIRSFRDDVPLGDLTPHIVVSDVEWDATAAVKWDATVITEGRISSVYMARGSSGWEDL